MWHTRVSIAVGALGWALLFPAEALCEAAKAGVVTTLQGTATVARATASQPTPLKFKDDVFMQDHIATGESSLVRILLGGKAVVTIRERSALTIHETASTATIEMTSGKIALAVAKDRMKPGESVQIKTPNALCGVRGTVVIADVDTPPAAGEPISTRFTLLTGIVDVTRLDAGQPAGPVTMLHPMQTVSVLGALPPGAVRVISRSEVQAIAKAYKVSVPPPPAPANAQVTARQIEQAVQQAAALNGTPVAARAKGDKASANDRDGAAGDDKGRGDRAGDDKIGDGDTGRTLDKESAKADKSDGKDDKDKGGKSDGKAVAKADSGEGASGGKGSDKGADDKGDKNGSKGSVSKGGGSPAGSNPGGSGVAGNPGGNGGGTGIPGGGIGGIGGGGRPKKGK
jgi:hypothetical protein